MDRVSVGTDELTPAINIHPIPVLRQKLFEIVQNLTLARIGFKRGVLLRCRCLLDAALQIQLLAGLPKGKRLCLYLLNLLIGDVP